MLDSESLKNLEGKLDECMADMRAALDKGDKEEFRRAKDEYIFVSGTMRTLALMR